MKLPLDTSDAPSRASTATGRRDAVDSCVRRMRQIYINRNQAVVSAICWDAYLYILSVLQSDINQFMASMPS